MTPTRCALIYSTFTNAYYVFQLCDKANYPTLISFIGNIVMAFAFLFVGPAPFLDLKTSTGLIQAMLGLGGFGYAFVMVSTFSRAQKDALKKGFADDIQTHLMISGVFISY